MLWLTVLCETKTETKRNKKRNKKRNILISKEKKCSMLLILHFAFWNYVASIPCPLFCLRFLHPAFCILELCCLESMLLVLFMVFTSCNYLASILCALFISATYILPFEICSLDLHFFAFYILRSVFFNDVALIL